MKPLILLYAAVALSAIAVLVAVERGVLLNIILASFGCSIFLFLLARGYINRRGVPGKK